MTETSSKEALFKASIREIEQTEWCARVLAEPGWIRMNRLPSLEPKETSEDSFMAETLSGPRRIEGAICLYSAPEDTPEWAAAGHLRSAAAVRRTRAFFSVGSRINGFPGVSHGGFVATLVDEVMGMLLGVNSSLAARALANDYSAQAHRDGQWKVPVDSAGPSGGAGGGGAGKGNTPTSFMSMTAYLNIRYKQPLETPAIVRADAHIERVEGRKTFVRAVLTGSDGQKYCDADGLFVIPSRVLATPAPKQQEPVGRPSKL